MHRGDDAIIEEAELRYLYDARFHAKANVACDVIGVTKKSAEHTIIIWALHAAEKLEETLAEREVDGG